MKLGCEQYGIDIKYIDNIVRMQNITRVPKAQPYFKGVTNLRGEIIPVMSLRRKFKLEDDEFTDKSRIIIIKSLQDKEVISFEKIYHNRFCCYCAFFDVSIVFFIRLQSRSAVCLRVCLCLF